MRRQRNASACSSPRTGRGELRAPRWRAEVGSDSPAGGLRCAVELSDCSKFWRCYGRYQGQRARGGQSKNNARGEEKTLTCLTQTGESFSLDSKRAEAVRDPFTEDRSPVNGSIHCPTHRKADGLRRQPSASACSSLRTGRGESRVPRWRAEVGSDSPAGGLRCAVELSDCSKFWRCSGRHQASNA